MRNYLGFNQIQLGVFSPKMDKSNATVITTMTGPEDEQANGSIENSQSNKGWIILIADAIIDVLHVHKF